MSVINICGVLIHSLPQQTEAVRQRLVEEAGIEVHTVSDDGRMIVTIEKDTQQETGETLNRLQSLDHIISASVVYQYFEDGVAEEEVLS